MSSFRQPWGTESLSLQPGVVEGDPQEVARYSSSKVPPLPAPFFHWSHVHNYRLRHRSVQILSFNWGVQSYSIRLLPWKTGTEREVVIVVSQSCESLAFGTRWLYSYTRSHLPKPFNHLLGSLWEETSKGKRPCCFIYLDLHIWLKQKHGTPMSRYKHKHPATEEQEYCDSLIRSHSSHLLPFLQTSSKEDCACVCWQIGFLWIFIGVCIIGARLSLCVPGEHSFPLHWGHIPAHCQTCTFLTSLVMPY